MVLSTEIPQDIIDEIIDTLREDSGALKTCTSVSHSFRLRSRQLLFSTITIDSPRAVLLLRNLLYWRPEISRLIYTLRIVFLSRDTFLQLPLVLSRLGHVQNLELGNQGTYTKFDRVLTDYNLMIMEVLKLPRIHTLSLHSILSFPSTFLRIPPNLTHLNMIYVECVQSPHLDSVVTSPNQPLKSVHVCDILSIPRWPLPGSSTFRRLVIGKSGQRAQPVLDAGSQSIEEVVWRDYSFYDYGSVDFSALQNLRRLSFEILVARDMETPQINMLWESINNLLKQGSVAQHLEALNFAIKPYKTLGYLERDVPYMGEGAIWSCLANSSYYPRLQKITVHIDNEFYDSPVKNESFRSAIRRDFSVLEATGKLHASLCEDFDWRSFI